MLHFATATWENCIVRHTVTIALFMLPLSAPGILWYVDSSVASSGNGQSWSTAWKNLSSISGLSPGDTVYISGGTASRTYSISAGWSPAGGTSNNPITYSVGTDSSHNGVVFLDAGGQFGVLNPGNYSTFNGNAGGSRHIVVTNVDVGTSSYYCTIINQNSGTCAGWVFRYIEFQGGITISMSGKGGIEFDHCQWDAVNNANRALFLQGDYADNCMEGYVHDCTFTVSAVTPHDQEGDDAIAGGNITISNCTFNSVDLPGYTGNQHQDFIQTSLGEAHIINCLFQNSVQYGVYGEFAYDGSDLQVINCVCVNCYAGGIVIGPTGNGRNISGVLVYNNLNYGGAGMQVNSVYSGSMYTDTYVYNNIAVDDGGFDFAGASSQITTAHNVTMSTTAGFLNAPADFHLTSAATGLIGQGTNLYSTFNCDKDGNARPPAGAWDIGPYQYGAGSPGIFVSPNNYWFGSVVTNRSATNVTFTVKNIGTGLLVGTSSVAAPFTISSGNTYSLAHNQTQQVTVLFSPTVTNSYLKTVTFTGGGGTNGVVSGEGTAAGIPITPQGIHTIVP
jgi:hypothetical protein